jgi:hypothetical protein
MGFIDDVASGFGIGGGGGAVTPEFSMVRGAFGTGSVDYDPATGITSSLSPKYQALIDELLAERKLSPEQQELARSATAKGAGFLEALGSTDPFDIAEKQFERMESILAPGRERSRSALESRLLRQGRLGSTGGALSQEGLETAIEQSRRAGLAEAFQQAQGVQAQQADIGQKLGAFGLTSEQEQLQRILSAISGATATEAMPLSALGPLIEFASTGKRAADVARAQEAASGGGFGEALGSGARSYLLNEIGLG